MKIFEGCICFSDDDVSEFFYLYVLEPGHFQSFI